MAESRESRPKHTEEEKGSEGELEEEEEPFSPLPESAEQVYPPLVSSLASFNYWTTGGGPARESRELHNSNPR